MWGGGSVQGYSRLGTTDNEGVYIRVDLMYQYGVVRGE